MFGATLKYFNLFVLPNPKFSVPISELEPVYRIHPRAPENDTSFLSHNSLSESKSAAGLDTPKKLAGNSASPKILDAETRTRRRNTFCQSDTDKVFSHSDSNEMPYQLFEPFDFEISPDRTSELSRNPRTRVRIVAPSDSPNRSIANRKLTHDIAALYSSNGTQEGKIARNITNSCKSGPSAKGKEAKTINTFHKRISAPPILGVYRDEVQASKCKTPQISELGSPSSGIYALPRSQLISSTNFLPPTFAHQSQNRPFPPRIPPSSSNAIKPFENDLSPIIEDIFTFSDPLDINEDSLVASTADSSGSSYGQLLGEMHVDYFSLSHFGGLEWSNDEKSRHTDCSAQFSTQGFGDTQDPGWMGDILGTVEQLNLIPELTLTAPTPDLVDSAQFSSGSGSEPRPLLFEDGADGMLKQQKIPETVALNNRTSDSGYPFLDFNPPKLDLALGLNRGCPGTSSRTNPSLGQENQRVVNKVALEIVDKNSETRRASGFRTRWSISRVDEKAKENIAPDKTGGVWKKISRILDRVSPPNSRRQSVLAGLHLPSTVNDASCQPRPRLSSQVQRSDGTVPSKRDSGLFLASVPIRIHEEGEHAASRLFGLPSTGLSAKRSKNEAGNMPKGGDEATCQAKRRSFGFNVKAFRNRRRYLDEDAE